MALGTLSSADAWAWLFHEHADITTEALENLGEEQQRQFRALWSRVRTGSTARAHRLCTDPFIMGTSSEVGGWCIGFAAVPPIAGDHSCAPGDLARAVLEEAWVGDVLKSASRARDSLRAAGNDVAGRIDAWARQHLDLQLDDVQYRRRAGANSAHFQLPRTSDNLDEYLGRVLTTGGEVNAIAVYANYHSAAVTAAVRAHDEGTGANPEVTWTVLVLEGLALHFLEDAFSAGHIAGAHGPAAQRKGTHDYYCEHGVSGSTWANGIYYHAHGDAFLTHVDAARARVAVGASIEQVLRALEVGMPTRDLVYSRGDPAFNTCAAPEVPIGLDRLMGSNLLKSVMQNVLKPLPQAPYPVAFSGEVGAFINTSLNGQLEVIAGGNGIREFRDTVPYAGRFWGGLGAGLGLEGIAGRTNDLFYAVTFLAGVIEGPTVPAPKVGFGVDLHIPFAYLPGDGLLWAALALLDIWHRPFVLSATGPLELWGKHAFLSRDTTIQFAFGRSLVTFFYPRPEPNDENLARWEFHAPIVSTTFGTSYSSPMASSVKADLTAVYTHSFDPNRVLEPEQTFGIGVVLSTGMRYFP
ncbi:MAG: hypothetical protein HYV07_03540 [Deltaproteobacteria bacterium]|nr:hypothetical protein [Deltaproteobacteria bacterium]